MPDKEEAATTMPLWKPKPLWKSIWIKILIGLTIAIIAEIIREYPQWLWLALLVIIEVWLYILARGLLRLINIFLVPALVIVLAYYGWWIPNHVPSEILNAREEIRMIQRALTGVDVCTFESRGINSDASSTKLWIRYGNNTLDNLLEETTAGSYVMRRYIKAGRVIALEAPTENGFSQTYYDSNGCTIGTDFLNSKRFVTELLYSGCGRVNRRQDADNTLFWPKGDQPFKAPSGGRPCELRYSIDAGPNISVPALPVPVLGQYR